MRFRLGLVFVVLGVGISPPVLAQFVQYIPPGTFRESRETTEQALERNMETARWKAGRALFDPWFGVRNFGYVDNAGGTGESDFTATAGVGLRGWLPVGSELTLAGHVLPEYVWWKDLTERNRWNGRYGVGLFGNLGRTGVALTAARVDDSQFFSQELQDKVNTQRNEAAARFEVDLGQGFSLFADGAYQQIDYLEEPGQELPSLSAVDRDEQLYQLGFGYLLPRGFEIGLGAAYSEATFDPGPSDRSNSGVGPVLVLSYPGETLFLRADMVYWSLEPEGEGSRFVDFNGVTGSFLLSFRALDRLEPELYARSNLAYSFTDIWAYYENTYVGVGLRIGLARWAMLRPFYESGTDDYTPFAADGPERSDDFDTPGVELTFNLDRVQISLRWSETDFDSNLPTFDRKITQLTSYVTFGLGSGLSWN